jgi:serine/threonine-protein kinase RsbW
MCGPAPVDTQTDVRSRYGSVIAGYSGWGVHDREVAVSWRRFILDPHREVSASTVEVRFPAERSQLFVIRSLVTAVALRQDYDLDEVEDIKLAVDELCSALITRARLGEPLTCQFDIVPGRIAILAFVGTDTDRPIERHTFGWHVLVTVADDVTTWVTPGHRSPHVLHVRMSKSR